MRTLSRAAAVFCLFASAVLAMNPASAAPVSEPISISGMYYRLELVTAATGLNGGQCPDSLGEYVTLYEYWPGPNGTGFNQHGIVNYNGAVGIYTDTNFPKTPKVGATSWSGIYDFTVYENGGIVQRGTGTFSTEFTTVDGLSSYGTNIFTLSLNGVPFCQESRQFTRIFTGLP